MLESQGATDACQKRFSWFLDWNPKVRKYANLLRFRKMLKNAPTLAIGGVDTAENGPFEV